MPPPAIELLCGASSTLRAHPPSFLQPHLSVGQSLFQSSYPPSTPTLSAPLHLTPVILFFFFGLEIVWSCRYATAFAYCRAFAPYPHPHPHYMYTPLISSHD